MDQLVSLDNTSEGKSFFHLDFLGSTANLTDESGGTRQSILYDAWGNERDRVGTSANNFTFTGHEKDEETGLIYAKARFYDPGVGRFLTQDSILGDVTRVPSLHRYYYANANPTKYFDPTGYASVYAGRVEDLAVYTELSLEREDVDAPRLNQRLLSDRRQRRSEAEKNRQLAEQKARSEAFLNRLDELAVFGFTHYARITIEESDFTNGQLDHAKLLESLEARTGSFASDEIPELKSALGQVLQDAQVGEQYDISELYSLAYNASLERTYKEVQAASGDKDASSLSAQGALAGLGGFAPQDVVRDAKFGLGLTTVESVTLARLGISLTRAALRKGAEIMARRAVEQGARSPVNGGVGSANLFRWAGDAYRTFRLRAMTRQATRLVDDALAAGDAARLNHLTGYSKQGWVRGALGHNGQRWRGLLIDDVVKAQAQSRAGFGGMRFARPGQYGPDIWNPATMRAWDITTRGQWPAHISQYISNPPPARPIWRVLRPLITN